MYNIIFNNNNKKRERGRRRKQNEMYIVKIKLAAFTFSCILFAVIKFIVRI
jgi:hypothetical protein